MATKFVKSKSHAKVFTTQYEDDRKTAAALTEQGLKGATGKPFTKAMIQWIRFKHKIKLPIKKSVFEYTVKEVHEMFRVSEDIVYRWIKNKYVKARKITDRSYLLEVPPSVAEELHKRITTSNHLNSMKFRTIPRQRAKKS